MSDTSISGAAAGAATSAMGGNAPAAAPTDAKKIHDVSQQFEAIFVRQMLSEARKTNMGDQLFSSQGTDTFREMQEQAFAAATTKSGGLGFARMIEKQLTAQMARTNAASAAATAKKD